MIITCPECSAQFILPDAVIAKPRKVKCTICAHIWTQMPEEEAPPEEIVTFEHPRAPDPSLLADIAQAANPIIRPRRTGEIVKRVLLVTLSLLLLTLVVAMATREVLVAKWPPSALFFEKMGMAAPPEGQGLELRDVTTVTSGDVLSVAGKISNITSRAIFMPNLLVIEKSVDKTVKEWPVPLFGKALAGQKTVGFKYDLQNAPPKGQSVTVIFSNK